MIEFGIMHKARFILDHLRLQAVMSIRFMHLPLHLSDELPACKAWRLVWILANLGLETFNELLVLVPLVLDAVSVIAHLIEHALDPLISVVLRLLQGALHDLPEYVLVHQLVPQLRLLQPALLLPPLPPVPAGIIDVGLLAPEVPPVLVRLLIHHLAEGLLGQLLVKAVILLLRGPLFALFRARAEKVRRGRALA